IIDLECLEVVGTCYDVQVIGYSKRALIHFSSIYELIRNDPFQCIIGFGSVVLIHFGDNCEPFKQPPCREPLRDLSHTWEGTICQAYATGQYQRQGRLAYAMSLGNEQERVMHSYIWAGY